MDQYLWGEGDLLLGDMADLALLSRPLTPLPVVVDVVTESSVGSPAGEPVVVPSNGMPDLSREGPFDVHQDALESGATPQVLDNLPGCQYRMTSYDDVADRSDLAYICTIRGYWSMLVRPSRLACSAEHRRTGCTIWVGSYSMLRD